MNSGQKSRVIKTVLTAMFVAMIAITTAFVKLPMSTNGYVHLGDSLIYLAACFLPTPFAVAAAALGGGLADLLAGYPHYIIFTVIIKAANAVFFTSKKENLLNNWNILMVVPSGLVTIVGYFIAHFMLYYADTFEASLAGAATTILGNTGQAVAGGFLFIVAAAAFDAAKLKKRLLK